MAQIDISSPPLKSASRWQTRSVCATSCHREADCRFLAESRQSCPRRTTFLRFFGVGVEQDLVALPVGLRFLRFAVASAKPTKTPGAPEERELAAAVPASWQAGGNNDRGPEEARID
jgi:hypothetical protein